MKKSIKLLFAFFIFSTLQAQNAGTISIFANAGYTFDETVSYDFGELKIGSGLQWGGGLEYFLSKENAVELKYNRIDSDFSVSGVLNGVNTNNSSDGSVQNYLVGFNRYFYTGGSSKAVPFIGGSIGLGIVDTPEFSAETGFAFDIRAGVKIKTSGPVSIKLQAYLQSMLTEAGYDYWNYYGYPVAVPEYARILQFGFGTVIGFDVK